MGMQKYVFTHNQNLLQSCFALLVLQLWKIDNSVFLGSQIMFLIVILEVLECAAASLQIKDIIENAVVKYIN